ncbi:hypothetical protein RJ641_014505 [Dillenia turbinata]|uniref:Uncharacterized protein n=1 Tax=Dillenia turbinata TaxID=194707 RepID=A0AAN8V1D6_9MAGN
MENMREKALLVLAHHTSVPSYGVVGHWRQHEGDLKNSSSTRRGLKSKCKGEPCVGTNPIVCWRCWRYRKDWTKNRQKLAGCLLGFGHKT